MQTYIKRGTWKLSFYRELLQITISSHMEQLFAKLQMRLPLAKVAQSMELFFI